MFPFASQLSHLAPDSDVDIADPDTCVFYDIDCGGTSVCSDVNDTFRCECRDGWRYKGIGNFCHGTGTMIDCMVLVIA